MFLSELTEGRNHVLFLFIYSHIMQNYASHLRYRIEMQGPQNTSALVSLGSYNEVPQAGWLRTAEIHGLAVLGAGSVKSQCWRGCGGSSEDLTQAVPGLGDSWLEAAQLQPDFCPGPPFIPVSSQWIRADLKDLLYFG